MNFDKFKDRKLRGIKASFVLDVSEKDILEMAYTALEDVEDDENVDEDNIREEIEKKIVETTKKLKPIDIYQYVALARFSSDPILHFGFTEGEENFLDDVDLGDVQSIDACNEKLLQYIMYAIATNTH